MFIMKFPVIFLFVGMVRTYYGPDIVYLSPSTTSYTVTEGETMSAIRCYATCYPSCTYKWSRSGSTVSSTATLNLGQAVKGEAGSYVCQARNTASGRSKNGPVLSITVRYSPYIVTLSPPTTSYIVSERDTIPAITCSAICYPSCTYKWSRSGSTVSSTATLSLGQAMRGEAGSYVCIARNPGSGRTKNGAAVSVTVRYGPDGVYLAPSSTSYTVTEGDTLRAITCSATCNPSCTYKWARSGSTVSSTATLNLGQAVRGEAGSYVCEARNTASGRFKNGPTVSITVRYSPYIVSLSPATTSYTVTEGNTIPAITCSAICYPACTYKWSKSGSTISSTAILNLGQAVRGEAGYYVCQARNPLSGRSKNGPTMHVFVRYGPENVSLSPSQTSYTVTEGNTMQVITCSATCYPACTYTWSRSEVTVNSTAALSLGQVDRGEAGSYVCTARNPSLGISRNGTVVKVTVRYGPDKVSPSTTSLTVTEGDTMRVITCYATCNPSCTYTWSRSGLMVSSTLSLNLGQALRGKAGSYVCQASNPGSGRSKNGPVVNVSVRYAPHVVISQSTPLLLENTPLDILCKASGVPAVYNYTDFVQRVGDVVVPNSHIESPGVMDSISVNISSLQLQDTGIYTCYVHNGITDLDKQLIQTASHRIEVSASPHYFIEETIFAGETSANITIEVPFVSFPEYTSHSVIRHDGQPVLMNEKYTLYLRNESVYAVFYGQQVTLSGNVLQVTISDLEEKDFGIYNIQITNDINTAKLSIDIKAQSKPSPPTDLDWTTSDKTVNFEWEKGFNGGYEQTFVLNTSLSSDGSWMYITTIKESESKYIHNDGKFHVSLTNLEPGVYSARIVSFNLIGATDPVEFKTSFEIMKYSKESSARQLSVTPVIGGTIGATLLLVFVIVGFIKRKYACSIKRAGRREDLYQNTHSELKTVSKGVDNPQYIPAAQTYEELPMTTDIGAYTDLKNVNDGSDYPNVYALLDDSRLNPISNEDTVEKEDPIYINLVLRNPEQRQKSPFNTTPC